MTSRKKSVSKVTQAEAERLAKYVAYGVVSIILLIFGALAIKLCLWILN